jgi:hypothetical protein
MPEPYAEQYQVVVKIHLDGDQWGAVVGRIRSRASPDSAIP